ncbi:MAG: short-subunit dehydrogenase [Porticoccaceae bacterium]|jgi:short-subunit dehydrogenase
MSNQTALVTGASDGIGLEFCTILASRGYNLILVARREAKLNAIAIDLRQSHGVQCTVIAADLSLPQAAQILFQNTKDQRLQVDFLINNAGLLHNGPFCELSLTQQEAMITVNVLALTSLTHLFANDMAARKTGHILNIASVAAWTPIPNQNIYAATKAYVLAFSQALTDEMKAAGNGVIVSVLCPGYTATKMMDNPDQGATLRIPANMMMSPKDVANQGIVGCLSEKHTIVPGISNKLGTAITHLATKMSLAKLLGRFYRKNMS